MSSPNNSYSDFEKHLLQCESVEGNVRQPENDPADNNSEDDEPSYLNISIQIKATINSPMGKQFADSFSERLRSMSKSFTEDSTIKVENYDGVFKKNKFDDSIFVPSLINIESCEFNHNCQTSLPNNTIQNVDTNTVINNHICNNNSPIESGKILQNDIVGIDNFLVFTASDTATSESDFPIRQKCKRLKKRIIQSSDEEQVSRDIPEKCENEIIFEGKRKKACDGGEILVSSRKQKNMRKAKEGCGKIERSCAINKNVEIPSNEMSDYCRKESNMKKAKARSTSKKITKIIRGDSKQAEMNDVDNDLLTEECLEAIRNADEEMHNVTENSNSLKDLNIEISGHIPLAHTIETRVTQSPTAEQVLSFKKLGIQLKTGPFSAEEDRLITTNFQSFCKEHGLNYDPTPFLKFKYSTKGDHSIILSVQQRTHFVQYIGKGLLNRMLSSIYKRFRVLFANYKKGRFTEKEDRIIRHYLRTFSNDSKKFATLSKVLKRPCLAIEKRYNLLQRKAIVPSTSLSEKAETLIVEVMRVLEVKSVEELRGRTVKRKHWHAIAARMGYPKHEELRRFWLTSIQTKLYIQKPLKMHKILRELVERLYEEKARDFRSLSWKTLGLPYKHRHCTSQFLYSKFQLLVQNYVAPEVRHNFRKLIKLLRNKFAEGEILIPNVAPIEFVAGKIHKYEIRTRSESVS